MNERGNKGKGKIKCGAYRRSVTGYLPVLGHRPVKDVPAPCLCLHTNISERATIPTTSEEVIVVVLHHLRRQRQAAAVPRSCRHQLLEARTGLATFPTLPSTLRRISLLLFFLTRLLLSSSFITFLRFFALSFLPGPLPLPSASLPSLHRLHPLPQFLHHPPMQLPSSHRRRW